MKLKMAASNKEPRFRWNIKPDRQKYHMLYIFLHENVFPDLNNINSHWIKTSIKNFEKL